MSSLIECIRSGNVGECKAIIEEQGSAVVHIRDSQGLTPLHHACIKGLLEIATLLVDAGSDVNARTARNEAPLQYAVMRGSQPIIKFLLRAGADTHARDASGCTILHHAVLSRQTAAAIELLEASPDLSLIQDDIGRTSLHWACYGGLHDLAERLSISGSDINLQDRDGYTPLHLAAIFGHNMVARVLVDKGATPLLNEWKEGRTPMELASNKGHESLALYLSWAGNRPHLLPVKSKTALNREKLFMYIGFVISILGPLIAALIPILWAVPLLVIGTILVKMYKKRFDRKHSGRLSCGIFFGTITCLWLNFLFGVATWQSPIFTLIFVIAGTTTVVLSVRLATSSDAGVVVASESERMAVETATSKGTFPPDFCVTCAVKRLPRMKHCSVCGKCITRFDHHCVFLLGDVGKKNHSQFWILISCVLISALAFMRLAVIHVIDHLDDDTLWMNTTWMGFLIFWTICNTYWLFGLVSLQTRLIANNLTFNEYVNAARYEYLKDSRGQFFNPYDKGAISNFLTFLGFEEISSKNNSLQIPSLEV